MVFMLTIDIADVCNYVIKHELTEKFIFATEQLGFRR
jgi:hypothetical protein